ncbi:hypothetical protein [Nonomuraea sp. NPDC049129]|uniref:hypothetical protein n=1 Tax=Nonomuraea sp. NPDC049129 TaxID=3155272 RepID=UPI0033DD91C0
MIGHLPPFPVHAAVVRMVGGSKVCRVASSPKAWDEIRSYGLMTAGRNPAVHVGIVMPVPE